MNRTMSIKRKMYLKMRGLFFILDVFRKRTRLQFENVFCVLKKSCLPFLLYKLARMLSSVIIFILSLYIWQYCHDCRHNSDNKTTMDIYLIIVFKEKKTHKNWTYNFEKCIYNEINILENSMSKCHQLLKKNILKFILTDISSSS